MPEYSFLFGDSGRLVGTIADVDIAESRKSIGVLLFNAGVIHRVGPHRLNVKLARCLASDGIPSIRFDLSGQGDSPRAFETKTAKEQVMDDIGAAMNALADSCFVKDFVLFGFCSGGYHGYDAVLTHPRIKGLVMFDAFLYPTARSELYRYQMRIAERGLLKAVGGAAFRRAEGIVRKFRMSKIESRPPSDDRTAYYIGLPSKAEFAAAMRVQLDRGVKVHMIYAGQSFEKYNYAEQFADAFRKHGIADRVTTQYFSDIDHAVTDLDGQRALIDHVRHWIKSQMISA